ncbi:MULTISPECIES: acrEF/envCD operon transcriptional regulator [Citrobacter]|jgi:TetR/AcrR family transcriptional repressor of acrEF/envCD operon|uniref:AcrEF/envCD operon transcriptional regulator n=1 Tax=Citrobacter meridianamericanus TaxID=2894201 RepID=A0ABT1BCK0_9ENTR|nr:MULTISPECIES: acrEF/envCD operon transcriptional regulator [Citrobacter]MBC6503922.1 acrEF/envCD operon transcriptional regulator [Citrobacter freundii]MBC6556991.1 acrEF/envCD operon transcriptional regulator [Citrobacter braakii]MBC6508647.1 acrEF/envCD operon transcriptional regulator [Citrobacter freundii]MBP8544232.1 acrEF/envCD operon transcriptional regulator [Citrobacter sp. On2M]MBW5274557.1 acrEF/envCD operon transcriptional regulator [Citrobacter sp. On28M]
MARRTKADALKTRQHLIETAIVQFAARGVSNTTLNDIADAANVTRGALYWHFENKTQLFNELWLQQPPLRDLIQEQLVGRWGDNPLQRLQERLVVGLQYIAENPRQQALMQILYHKCEFHNDMISEQAIREKIGINHLDMRIALQQCMDEGLVATGLDLDVIIIILHGSFSGIVKNWLINPMSYDLYKQAPVLVDNVLKMLSPDGIVRQLTQSESQVG